MTNQIQLKAMKIGLFGGSFNPSHNTHLKIINEVLDKKIVDEVWVTPCKKHAFDKNLEEIKHRFNMINLIIKDNQKIKLNKVELNEKGKNHTLKTVNKLSKKYNHKFFIIIGSDILHEIKDWYQYKNLLKKMEFIVVKRKDYPLKKINGMKIYKTINKNLGKISSSSIRKKICLNKSIKKFLPKEIENYIKTNNLYKNEIQKSILNNRYDC